MQVDIKTQSVTPLRQTFSHVARHLGGDKPASRYLEATIGMQSTVNFHYRPLWQPELELYDVRRTRLVMRDWYVFKDPRQYYYGAYTIARARQQEAMEKNLDFVQKQNLLRGLPDAARERLAAALLPLRHAEWGANTSNCYITAYGYGTAITQAAMFQAMDRLGLAQYISRIGLALDGNTGESLARARTVWLEDAAWQGLRRLVEKLMVTHDWFELMLAQNLVLDALLYRLVYRHYVPRAAAEYGPALSLVTEFMSTWQEEAERWVDAVVKAAASESAANKALLRGWISHWRNAALQALEPYAALLLGAEAGPALAECAAALEARAARLGVPQEQPA